MARKCLGCRRYVGACICHQMARGHRRQQEERNQPTTCSQRFASGGTCHKTAPCGRDHGRF